MSGTPSPKQSSSSGSAASFIKVVEQLIQSDDQEIIARKMNELQTTFPILKMITPHLSNQEKLNLFLRDNNFKHKLMQKLLINVFVNDLLVFQFGTQKNPALRIKLYSIRYRSLICEQLDQSDLIKIFNLFGKISFIYVQKSSAYLQYQSLISSYLAIQILNGFQIIRDLIRLEVRWCKVEQDIIAEKLFFMKFNTNLQKNQKDSFEKYNCKYNIHLPCPPQFKIAQKIIGPKGNNIKKIFESISYKSKATGIQNIQKILKIRLRGHGSGYKQGLRQQQSDQIMNFCISSKQKALYELACAQIQRILQRLCKDYKLEYQRVNNRQLEGMAYKKYEMSSGNVYLESKQFLLQSIPSCLSLSGKKMTFYDIQQQINKRNKARNMGNYKEADEMRDNLKLKGVILIDALGNKNRLQTKWKFIEK